MERAASDLYEHQLTCPLAPEQPTPVATSMPQLRRLLKDDYLDDNER